MSFPQVQMYFLSSGMCRRRIREGGGLSCPNSSSVTIFRGETCSCIILKGDHTVIFIGGTATTSQRVGSTFGVHSQRTNVPYVELIGPDLGTNATDHQR
jgi:hypothetical protein